MTAKETGKSRSQRIQLDYHRARGGLYWMRWILSLAALLICGAYAAYAMFHPQGSLQVSTGPVALAHASFENDCQQCHGNSFLQPVANDAFHWDSEALNQLEASCQHCHRVDPHFRSELVDQSLDQNCAACHHDHQGRDHDMAAVAAAQCTNCHSKLNAFMLASAKPHVTTQTTNFSTASHAVSAGDGRTGFRSLLQDNGRILFDHAQHLAPGQVSPGTRGGFRRDMLPAEAQSRYAVTSDEQALVQLDCKNCHEPQGTSGNVISASDRENGRYYAPVSFEKHCKACHSLNFAGQTNDQLPLPHAAPWSEVKTLLAAKTLGGRITGSIDMTSETGILAPGKRPQAPGANDAPLSEVELNVAVERVRQQCLKCHQPSDLTDEFITSQQSSKRIEMIPSHWLQHGYFDHAAHPAITNCNYCHQVPDGKSLTTNENLPATDHQKVMIGGPETCVACHRDPSEPIPASLASPAQIEKTLGKKEQPTWASAECIECHRYHWTRDHNNIKNQSPPLEAVSHPVTIGAWVTR